MKEQDLIKQLNQLPKEIEAKDQWAQIQQSIESNSVVQLDVEPHSNRARWFYPASAVASLFLVAMFFVFSPKETNSAELTLAQQKTLQSLQQANGQYYSLLGNIMKQNQSAMPTDLQVTLKDLRNAQKVYRTELAQSPENTELYKKLIKTYRTERKLLKRVVT